MAMKKKEITFLEEIKRHNKVLWEDMRSQVRLVAEQYGSFVDRFNKINERFDSMEGRLNRVDLKLQEHDRRFDVIDIDLKTIKNALFELSHRMEAHEARAHSG
jgi:chromosome segregation ATPase